MDITTVNDIFISLGGVCDMINVEWTDTVNMATDCGLGLCCHRGYRWLTGPVLSSWLQMVDWACVVIVATDGGLGLCCHHGYRWWTGPVLSSWLQMVD